MKSLSDASRGGYWLLFLALVSPSCIAYAALPIQSFYKEWVACLFIFMATGLILSDGKILFKFSFSSGAALLLAAVATLSAVFDFGDTGSSFFYAAYALLFILCNALGQAVFTNNGQDKLFMMLVLAGLAGCFFAALQVTGFIGDGYWVLARAGGRVYGNIGQPNHFADITVFGMIGAVCLYVRGRLGSVILILVSVVFSLFVALSGARVSWGYVLILLMASAFFLYKWLAFQDREARRSLWAFFLLAFSIFLSWVLVVAFDPLSWFGGKSFDNLSERNSISTPLRFWFWKISWLAGVENPFFGVGAGGFVGFGSLKALLLQAMIPAAADSNAHNIFLHFLAEFGFPFTFVFMVMVVIWFWNGAKTVFCGGGGGGIACACAYIGALVVMAHSLVEHPLWYTYIVIPFGILCGFVDSCTPGWKLNFRVVWVKGGALAGVCVALFCYMSYWNIQSAMSRIVFQVSFGQTVKYDSYVESALNQGFGVWFPYGKYAEAILAMTKVPTKENVAVELARCRIVERTVPSPYVLARCAAGGVVAGDIPEADHYAIRLCRLYPRSTMEMIRSFQVAGVKVSELHKMRADCVRSFLGEN